MSDFLNTMASLSLERAEAAGTFTDADFDKPVTPLTLGTFDLIAEIKNRSPAEGKLADAASSRTTRAQQYVEGGAAAISVLTEPSQFAGALEHLEEVVAAVPDTPVMRKDFLVETVQILEARKHGASGVLLIMAMRDDRCLRDMLDCAAEHNMFVLLECFDSGDLARAGNRQPLSEYRAGRDRSPRPPLLRLVDRLLPRPATDRVDRWLR